MSAHEVVQQVFVDVLELEQPVDWESVRYQETKRWDSLGHMAIVAELEEQFSVMLEAEDIIEMSNFGKCLEILAKYGVE